MELYLPMKGEYFDQIKAGTKTEEYRLRNDYWCKKLLRNRKYDNIVLTRGYPKRDDKDRRLILPYRGYRLKSITHPHFGKELVMVFVIDVTAP